MRSQAGRAAPPAAPPTGDLEGALGSLLRSMNISLELGESSGDADAFGEIGDVLTGGLGVGGRVWAGGRLWVGGCGRAGVGGRVGQVRGWSGGRAASLGGLAVLEVTGVNSHFKGWGRVSARGTLWLAEKQEGMRATAEAPGSAAVPAAAPGLPPRLLHVARARPRCLPSTSFEG